MQLDDTTKPDPPEQGFLTVKQAAEYLNVSPSIVYRLCLTRKLSHYKFGQGGGAIRINRTELLEFIKQCQIEGTQQEIGDKAEGRRSRPQRRAYKHLDLRDEHPCGAMTKAGTACTLLTTDERCHLHRKRAATASEK